MWMGAGSGSTALTGGFGRMTRVHRLLTVAALLASQGVGAPAHFHHLHLNSTDPAGAIEFYTRTFDCEKARFAGVMDAVWAQKSWLLFTKTAAAPPADIGSASWHFGWVAEDMPH